VALPENVIAHIWQVNRSDGTRSRTRCSSTRASRGPAWSGAGPGLGKVLVPLNVGAVDEAELDAHLL
jgi:hypothetical protein